MKGVAVLKGARTAVLLVCLASLAAAGGRWATREPEGRGAHLLKILAKAPGFVADTVGDLVRNPFDESLTPDEFGGRFAYTPVPDHTGHGVTGLVMRRGADPALPGWMLVLGTFQMGGAENGKPGYAVLAISPQMAIEHVWPISGKMLTKHHFAVGQAPFPHGFAVLPDGSMVVAFDDVYLPVRFDACDRVIWTGKERLTHTMNLTNDARYAWSVGSQEDMRKIDLKTGKTVRDLTVDQIRAANPNLTIFEMRRIDDNDLGRNPRGDAGNYFHDPTHINDVEPLPARYAGAFPQFHPGDLLISMRSLNLVMVLDPATLKVEWHTNDYTLRQHDPDWEADGTITVFDNQNGRQATRIARFDPRVDLAHGANGAPPTDALAGGPIDFYSRIRGKHQTLPDGGMLVTSAEQGRIFETDAKGRIRLEMLVHDPARKGMNFVVSEADWFPSDSPVLSKVLSCQKTSSSKSPA